jgi:superfamily II RNA helicase
MKLLPCIVFAFSR